MTTPPSLGDQPRQVRITAEGTTATLHIDGVDFTNLVYAYALQQSSGQPPQLILHAHPHQQGAEFDGLAHVVIGDDPDPGRTVADFLTGLDPSQLQSAALNRNDLDGSATEITSAILKTLANWAQGRT